MKHSNIIYIGAFLEEEDKKEILKHIDLKYENVFLDHLTISFLPSPYEANSFEIGSSINVKINAEYLDEKCQTLSVEMVDNVFDISFPHITVTTSGDTKAVYSSELLNKKESENKKLDISLKLKIGFFTKENKKVFSLDRLKINTLNLPSRPQVDSVFAVYILKNFGKLFYENIENSKIEISSNVPEEKDKTTLFLDSSGDKYDHHNKKNETLTSLVLKELGLESCEIFKKSSSLISRDEKGKGTISEDPIDRAFGFSGLAASLNRTHSEDPEKVVESLGVLVDSHLKEEVKRVFTLPKLIKNLEISSGIEYFKVKQNKNNLNIVILSTDDVSVGGYLRSQIGGRFDIVAIWRSTGHLNIITRKTKRPNLDNLVSIIRKSEILLSDKNIDFSDIDLKAYGVLKEVPEWYYDTVTNSIFNGGLAVDKISPTIIKKDKLKSLMMLALNS